MIIRYLPFFHYMISVCSDARASVALTRIHQLLPLAEVPQTGDSNSTSVSIYYLSHSLRGCTQWWTEPISPRCFVLLWHCPWTYCSFNLWSLASDWCTARLFVNSSLPSSRGMYIVALYSFLHIVLPALFWCLIYNFIKVREKIIQL